MLSRNCRSEYEIRMHRVVAYIDKHLDQPLDLRALAEVAHFSPFISFGSSLRGWARRWATTAPSAC